MLLFIRICQKYYIRLNFLIKTIIIQTIIIQINNKNNKNNKHKLCIY